MDINENRNLKKIITLRNATWTQKNRFNKPFNDLYNECQSEDQLWIVSKLIEEFNFIDSSRFVDEVEKMGDCIQKTWMLNPKDTIITAICDSSKPDGSQSVIRTLETCLPVTWKNSIHNNINEAFHKPNQNIVLVDDFAGTGKKVYERIIRLMHHLKTNDYESNVYLVVLAGMEDGLDILEKALNGKSFCSIKMSKAISENISCSKEKARAIDAMIELEQRILLPTPYPKEERFMEYNFGFLLSEAIFFVEALNVPNNVFPIFWKERGYNNGKQITRDPIFRRR